MTKYLNFFESESGFTEAVEAGQLFFPNVSYTEEDDTVHWNLERPANPVETPMLRMSFSTSTPGQRVRLYRNDSYSGVTAMEIDGAPVNFDSEGYYSIAEPGNHTAVYQFASPEITQALFGSESGAFDTFTSAEITSAVTTVSAHAFSNCSGLSSVTIPDSVTVIGSHAFSGCSSLTSVTIPDSVTIIGDGVFTNCQSLQSVVLPDNLTVIKDSTFFGCQSLQSMVLPDSLTAIQSSVFFGCSSLYDINIPSGVTTIGQHAFLNCSGLTAIYLNSVTPPTLGANALDNTNDCPIYVPAASVETYKQACPGYASRIMPMKYTVTASVNDDSLGQVILGQETATEGETVGFSVNVFDPVGSEVMVIQIHDENFNEVQHTDEGDGNYSFTMPASDVNVSAFIIETGRHRITAQVNDSELGQVNIGQDSASEGEQVSFSVDVYDSETNGVTSVTVTDGNGNNVQVTDKGDNSYSFTMPGSDVIVSVVIGEKTGGDGSHRITAQVNDSELGQVSIGQDSASEGEQVSFSVDVFEPDANQVTSVTVTDGNGDEVEYTDEDYGEGVFHYTFTMPASDVTISVVIGEKGQYKISASVNDETLGEVMLGRETAPEGDRVEFGVYLYDEEQYQVSSVTVTDRNGDEVQVNDEGDNLYTFTMPASDVTIIVAIVPKQ